MEWKGGRRSDNLRDVRGIGAKGGLGLGGLIIVVLGVLFGQDVGTMLGFVEGMQGTTTTQQNQINPNDQDIDFFRVVLGSNEDVWQSQFRKHGLRFQAPQMKVFTQSISTGCGTGTAAMGPFYCSADQTIYLDLAFINDMQRMGASQNREVAGNFAMAYVIGHEFGHHVSNMTGRLRDSHQKMSMASSKADSNAISVKLELQADCYAGVWAANLDKYGIKINQNDIIAGINAASAVGDDRLMQSAGRAVNPENFTHGSAQQRVQWFSIGLKAGDMSACETFR